MVATVSGVGGRKPAHSKTLLGMVEGGTDSEAASPAGGIIKKELRMAKYDSGLTRLLVVYQFEW